MGAGDLGNCAAKGVGGSSVPEEMCYTADLSFAAFQQLSNEKEIDPRF